jgi:ABC-type nitrate/sulfonate/bicarbonate transport system ATPase subunit
MRLQVHGVRKSFRRSDGRPLDVLDDVSFTVEPRGFACLVGPSGCGKSTILNLLAGLIVPDAGMIRIGDRELDRGSHRIGYVFQRPRLLNWRTVRQNVEFALRADRVPPKEWRVRTHDVLSLVGLEQFADEYPLSLSGGMQQRVAIARALAIGPDVLLMDEPFSHLDELTARAQRRELLRFREKIEATIVFVTHNALEAVYLADRVYVLSARPTRIAAEFVIEAPRTREIDDAYVIGTQRVVLGALGIE